MASKQQLGNPALMMATTIAAQKASQAQGPPPPPRERLVRLTPEQQTVIGWSLIAAGGLALGFVTYKVVQKINRDRLQDRAFEQVDQYGEAADVALDLVNGINPDTVFGWSTDEVLIRETIRHKVPHKKFWEAVKDAYDNLTDGGNLNEDLESDLSRNEWKEIKNILRTKPANAREAANPANVNDEQLDAWAERINAGANYVYWYGYRGTDNEAIYAVFEDIPLVGILPYLDRKYRSKYRKTLLAEIAYEMDQDEIRHIYQILTDKPDAKGKNLLEVLRQG
ncbi:MAG: hypothetical protein AAGN35_15315 [Bacteroidota bacterium]